MLEFVRRWARVIGAKLQGEVEAVVDPTTLPLIDRCQYVYAHLDVAAFANYRRQYGQGKTVTVVHPNIHACIENIAEHIESLERGGYVLPAKVGYTATAKPINRFFVTKEGFYLESVQQSVLQLVDVVLALHAAVHEARHTEHDTKSYNLRMLNSLLYVLLELGFTLTDISREIRTSH